jgi:hypothetical protein
VNNLKAWEQRTVQELNQLYGAEGYTVEFEPKIPRALERLGRIDAVARRGDERVFIQIKQIGDRSVKSSSARSALVAAIEALPNARFDLFTIPDPAMNLPSRDDIEGRIRVARQLIASADSTSPGWVEAAVMLSAGALEGVLRSLAYRSEIWISQDAPMGGIASTLWSTGYLSDDQVRTIVEFNERRTLLVHGLKVGVEFTVDEIVAVCQLAEAVTRDVFLSAQDLIDWFLERYDSVEHHIPSGSAPGDANSILADAFPNVPSPVHSEAVSRLNEISVEWVRRREH